MTTLTNLGCGIVGSWGIELWALYEYYHHGPLPARYRRKGFWVVRSLISVVAGLIAVLYTPPNFALAFGLGAAAPSFLSDLATRARHQYSSARPGGA